MIGVQNEEQKITMWWFFLQCYGNVVAMLLQCYGNVIAMLWQCYCNVMMCTFLIALLWCPSVFGLTGLSHSKPSWGGFKWIMLWPGCELVTEYTQNWILYMKKYFRGVLGHKLSIIPKFEVFCDQFPGTWSQSGHILVTWTKHYSLETTSRRFWVV